jgi:hypothetical protein
MQLVSLDSVGLYEPDGLARGAFALLTEWLTLDLPPAGQVWFWHRGGSKW